MKPSVVFLNSTFPCLSETFVFDQFEVLREAGIELRLVANHRPAEKEIHPRMRAILSDVLYLNEIRAGEILLALLAAVFRHPLRCLRAMRAALAGEEALRTTLAHLAGAAVVLKRFGRLPGVRLHAHFTYGAAAVARWASALSGLPYGLTLHGSDLSFDFPPDLQEKLAGADLLVSISQFNVAYLREHFPAVQPRRLEVIGMGVPALPPPTRIPRGTGPWRILNVGRLSEHKAQHVLIEACTLLAARGADFRCDIVGEGPARPQLEAQIAARGLQERVRLLGSRFHDQVLALYGDADLFVLCSVTEGMPIVLMEAMRAGVPVIASAITAIPELVRDAGVLVPPGDAAALAAAVDRFISGQIEVAPLIARGQALIAKDYALVPNHLRFAELLREMAQIQRKSASGVAEALN